MANKKSYDVRLGVQKAVISVFIFAVPVLLDVLPSEFLDLTVGGLLVMALNYAKFKKNS